MIIIIIMSANKRRKNLTTRSVTHMKQSFEERICDDLCEQLLRYLSFEDRFRLESVSKQFQRTIFNQQLILDLDNNKLSFNINKLPKLINHLTMPSNLRSFANLDALEDEELFAINCRKLEFVLKKSTNIREINIGHKTGHKRDICLQNIDEVLQTITTFGNNLRSIGLRCDSLQLKTQTIVSFVAKFGLKLRSIEFPDKYNTMYRFCRSLMKMCPNLLALNGIRFKHLIEENEILAKSVIKLKNFSIGSTDQKSFEMFVKHFSSKVIELSIDFIPENSEEEFELINSLSQFKCLQILEITSKLYFRDTSNHLVRCLQSIATNCQNIKHLKFDVYIRDSMNGKSFANCFEGFKSLRHLDFVCLGLDLSNDQKFCLRSLKNCRHLSHLKLDVTQLDEQFYEELDVIVPNLAELDLQIRCDITDKAIESIARLKRLKNLKITVRTIYPISITELKTDLLFDQKFKSCPKFENFCLNKF